MAAPELLPIEVVFALASEQHQVRLAVPAGTTVAEAIAQTDFPERFPECDLRSATVGIFGQQVSAAHRLLAGDRIEIYRPLLVDPKAARRTRVARQRRGQA